VGLRLVKVYGLGTYSQLFTMFQHGRGGRETRVGSYLKKKKTFKILANNRTFSSGQHRTRTSLPSHNPFNLPYIHMHS
jgi:hypothetical protein